jgi:hypothetical protein
MTLTSFRENSFLVKSIGKARQYVNVILTVGDKTTTEGLNGYPEERF